MVARSWEGGRGEFVFTKYSVSVWDDEKVLKVARGDSCTLENVNTVNFTLCLFYHD